MKKLILSLFVLLSISSSVYATNIVTGKVEEDPEVASKLIEVLKRFPPGFLKQQVYWLKNGIIEFQDKDQQEILDNWLDSDNPQQAINESEIRWNDISRNVTPRNQNDKQGQDAKDTLSDDAEDSSLTGSI